MPRNRPDLFGGLLLIALAAAAAFFLLPLPFGTAARPGAAFLPMLVALLLGALGALVLVKAVAGPPDRVESGRVRPLLAVLGAIAAFALLLERAGLPAAVVGAVVAAALAQPRLLDWRTAAFALGLAAFSTAAFLYGLKLPFKLAP